MIYHKYICDKQYLLLYFGEKDLFSLVITVVSLPIYNFGLWYRIKVILIIVTHYRNNINNNN